MYQTKTRVTLKDIAEYAGVSLRTVSLAVQGTGRMSDTTRQKILKLAKEWNYRPNIMARGLVNQKTYIIGVILPYVSKSFYADVLCGIEEKCKEHSYDLLLRSAGDDIDIEKNAVERMLDRKVDGIICYPSPCGYELYKNVIDSGIPLIQVSRTVPGLDAPSVTIDNELGTFMAVSRLIELGHRNIGYIGSGSGTPLMNARRDGYRKALVKHGISLDLDSYELLGGVSLEGGTQATEELLKRNPEMTAIATSTDLAAIGAVRACLSNGKRIPEDMSVMGFDDLSASKFQAKYPLSCVALPKKEIGTIAFDLFFRKIQGEVVESVVLKPGLVERNTTCNASV